MRIRTTNKVLFWVLLAVVLSGVNCARTPTSDDFGQASPDESGLLGETQSVDLCPDTATAPERLPGVNPEHEQLRYWLDRLSEEVDIDEVLLTPEEIQNHNTALLAHQTERPLGLYDLMEPIDALDFDVKVNERLLWMVEQFESQAYVEADGSPAAVASLTSFQPTDLPDVLGMELRVALDLVPIRCGPRQQGFYTPSLDMRFDRNNCSSAHAQEVVQILAPWPNGMVLARTRYSYGWISGDAALSPPIPVDVLDTWLNGTTVQLNADAQLVGDDGRQLSVPAGTTLPLFEEGENTVHFASSTGFHITGLAVDSEFVHTGRSLTRRALFQEAFQYLHTPYGWGGEGGGRDCSRFLLDVFESFGMELPRHSGYQAHAGTFTIDVSELENEAERVLLLESAARRGIVLLHFPGHIMLYLGLDDEGHPMAIHSFAEYLEPCDLPTEDGENTETLHTVDGVSVSDLELGRGSSRTAFIERITRIVVIGRSPGLQLRGVAESRGAAPVEIPSSSDCEDTEEIAIFLSPRSPNVDQPLRVIVTTEEDPGPMELVLLNPDDEIIIPEVTRLGAPPFSIIATIEQPAHGNWQAVFGDGNNAAACERFRVHSHPRLLDSDRNGPVWEIRNTWNTATENLYAAFIESLFDYPAEEDLTWTSLHEVTRDPQRNFLFDHLSFDEDYSLLLEPDCADLPYFLRAYFSWKMGLPYAYRRCRRGSAGRPPTCSELNTNLMQRERVGNVDAFDRFLNYHVRRGVHSGSGRTGPGDDETDYYPVELSPESLPPGTLFADPYGHLLVVAAWEPQGLDEYGILIGADAQPDGTVGRRRFWRGSFLFSPSTEDVGAGFKAFRPLVFDPPAGYQELAGWAPSEQPDLGTEETGTIDPDADPIDFGPEWLIALDNDALAETQVFARYSEQQYLGTVDDFYETVESLINPRPLDPIAMQLSLVDALDEAVSRRINSVNNGEAYLVERGFPTVEMPEGYSIFETSGAWEDYSTPSRDMRLLISLDTVVNFPDVVERAPERFGVTGNEGLQSVLDEVVQTLALGLQAHSFEYMRSDGSTWTLTLEDVVDRMTQFEMAYNPNDCAEIRWGAVDGTEEYATCNRHAPAFQVRRMESYRDWFITRTRPPR